MATDQYRRPVPASGFATRSGPTRAATVFARQAVVRIDRDADWVFRELHDPRTLITCVPGGHIIRIIDARSFEACVVAGVGPFKIAYTGIGQIKESDPGSRTASLTIAGGGVGMPPSQVRMSMVVWAVGPGAELEMSFRLSLEGRLLSRELVDFIMGDLVDRTARRIKLQLESRPMPPFGTAA
ncbi:MAG TPA: SRPBCC domain-containing protein [Candidatus Angelobacter sp.]|nr:SRPBCC domain-containing protein [Candidatus Angelobacter sp.]